MLYCYELRIGVSCNTQYEDRMVPRFFPALAVYRPNDPSSGKLLVVLAFGTVRCTTQRLDGVVVDYPFTISPQVYIVKDIIPETLKRYHVNPGIVLDEQVRRAMKYLIMYLYVLTITFAVCLYL